ncbi:GGDEF domain-containing protein [Devosia rhodophyticola]|uniref:GGDEF domain-containing protein n=1 Tax=Devosia rhodophyticola TaxID=3026423 RepID=A0ABY7YYH2_9HYPH|nr:GGDEF domain-containing protein [Devosia rhodophyticola]WDR06411.1 GGDEF domain-containing protein [Devosia rhodophyticola]
MSVSDLSPASNDLFWGKVRAALGGLRIGRDSERERTPAYGKAAIARSLGMKPRLSAELEAEMAEAWMVSGVINVSMCLMVIDLDRFGDYFSAYGKVVSEECVETVLATINANLPREQDRCFRFGRNQFVVVLPDYPLLLARKGAGKIIKAVHDEAVQHKESHAGVVTVSIGIAVANPTGNLDKKFFEVAAQAQAKAARRGLGRLQTVDLRKPKGDRARSGAARKAKAA